MQLIDFRRLCASPPPCSFYYNIQNRNLAYLYPSSPKRDKTTPRALCGSDSTIPTKAARAADAARAVRLISDHCTLCRKLAQNAPPNGTGAPQRLQYCARIDAAARESAGLTACPAEPCRNLRVSSPAGVLSAVRGRLRLAAVIATTAAAGAAQTVTRTSQSVPPLCFTPPAPETSPAYPSPALRLYLLRRPETSKAPLQTAAKRPRTEGSAPQSDGNCFCGCFHDSPPEKQSGQHGKTC